MRGVCGRPYGDLTFAAMLRGFDCRDLTGSIDRCGVVTDLWRGMDWPLGAFIAAFPGDAGGFS